MKDLLTIKSLLDCDKITAIQYTSDNDEDIREVLPSQYEVHRLLNNKLVIVDAGPDKCTVADVLLVEDYLIMYHDENNELIFHTVKHPKDFAEEFAVIQE